MGFSNLSRSPRALVIGLNPSPVDRIRAWSPMASATAALSYIAFDKPHVPTEVNRWLDMRNLNRSMIDDTVISRIDPVEAMSELADWADQDLLHGPIVACGRTVTLVLEAFRASTKMRLSPIIRIPHPSCLWLPHRGVPIATWNRARKNLCRTLGLPALPEIIDRADIDNAQAGFGAYLNQALLAEAIAQDEEVALPQYVGRFDDEDDWAEEVDYWRTSARHDERSDQADRFQAADRLIADGDWHGD